ncbi:DUF1883 domain-containing protein [Candidatus Sodalis endolongispinus]|uniref:DUF1883 domain-containing protein n=1 Tax=Candidatus Sodalis endolongispinus TaxID=2812662 RepID=A0ABS5Y978_9GAMM|nr:DUF1883 domain-containing protein [Candidatus Sodalis endolongispinus]MBT9431219.1 DUF1883 domain-containing protein [Candidatus Sodalis endolongispinus]
MSVIRTRLKLFGGDTVVVHCSEKCNIHLMCESQPHNGHMTVGFGEILGVSDTDTAYLWVPYSGLWSVIIDAKSESQEHSVSYLTA